ncbi:hypothetical protein BDU57DRAFT_552405 [Ampelomyces quisqualis]|uniref:C3H1-type domain-containing protein n=1 Tax=Ampelomyces quisqualis TaxID=50730 RepID=A0A6A5Q8T5_AMPQU|nr:hypothetical protein BDU57DRAFT_552405 [Ampelomyces quisqualis]
MERKHDSDGIDTIVQLKALQLSDTAAMKELEAATKLCQNALQASTSSYKQLLAQYTALKETVQANAKGQSQAGELDDAQKYVLVLIDAHSHTFGDAFLRGEATADVVENIVKNILERRRPKLTTLQIVAKVYADYETLSEKVSLDEQSERMNVVLALTQKFSSANPWVDFINVSHNVLVKKITGMFLWHKQDPRCAHILLSTSVHKLYDEMMSKHPEYSNRTTNIPIAMTEDLSDTVYTGVEAKASTFHDQEAIGVQDTSSFVPMESERTGSLQMQGRYGNFENNRYVAHTPLNAEAQAFNSTIRPLQGSHSPTAQLIPINAAGYRIDTFLKTPTKDEYIKFKQRTEHMNLCTSYHLTGHCSVGNCRFDHSSITPKILHVLRQKIRGSPCISRGRCRRADCFRGHICLAKGCARRKQTWCQFSPEAHGVDLKIEEWILPAAGEKVLRDKPVYKDGLRQKDSSEGSMKNWPTMVDDLI